MSKVADWKEDERKFKELILYISEKCASHVKFGATKLNKILFYSDFNAVLRLGRPITGAEYQKLEHGPAPRRFIPIQQEMQAGGELAIQPKRLWSGKTQHRPVNLRTPDLSCFTAEEIALVDEVIEALRDMTADEVSQASHTELGWEAASYGENIPYETAFIDTRFPNEKDIERSKKILKEQAQFLNSLV